MGSEKGVGVGDEEVLLLLLLLMLLFLKLLLKPGLFISHKP